MESKGKLILTETSHRCKNMIFKSIDFIESDLLRAATEHRSRLRGSVRASGVSDDFYEELRQAAKRPSSIAL